MNNLLIQINLKIFQETTIKPGIIEKNTQTNWWLWLAIIELIIIIVLFLKEKLKSKDITKKKSSEQEIDFNNIINSSFNSLELYNKLKVKCHPDCFPIDIEKNLIAKNLFQEITKNKNNIKRLLELKEEAKQKLNITL